MPPARIEALAHPFAGVPKNSLPRAQTGYERAKLRPHCWPIFGTVDIR
jgi:hypothetical protein